MYRVNVEFVEGRWTYIDFDNADDARGYINDHVIEDGKINALFYIERFCTMDTAAFLAGDNFALVDYTR